MARYGYTKLVWSNMDRKSIVLFSTDSQVVKWFLIEVEKIAPGCKVAVEKLSSGEPHRVVVEKLRPHTPGDAVAVAYWTIGQLGQRGWEPFAVDTYTLDLRKDYE